METELQDIDAMYITSENGPQGAADAFKKLEDAIHWQLKGRKFYGTMDGKTREYRANLAIIDEQEPQKLGFKTWKIPGGKYYKDKITDWEQHVTEIAPRFDAIIEQVQYDDSRPMIEFYRSQAELCLFVPIK